MNRFMLPMQLTCLTLAVCTQLYAQDNVVTNSASQTSSVGVQQKETTQLAPIVVTATRSAKSIADIAGTVYSIDQAEIENRPMLARALPIFWEHWFHLLHRVAEQPQTMA